MILQRFMRKRNEVLRNLSKGNKERMEIRLKYCGRLKERFSIIGMYCLYVELCPRLSLELDSLSRLLPKMDAVILTLPDLGLCDVNFGFPAVTG